MPQKMGPIILDILGTELASEEHELLQHPLIGGVILFSRNYSSIQQLTELCHAMRETRKTPLLIAVDQEGGRVQRFKEPFLRLPSMETIGQWHNDSESEGVALAETCGWLMAAELLAAGIDLSFAPVLDLNKGINHMIGDRAFHGTFQPVITLAKAFIKGMHTAGMAATGKHFPGHGGVTTDSHLALPVDNRTLDKMLEEDMQPFMTLSSHLDAMMSAHIIFPAIDHKAVSFSDYWLRTILRQRFQFSGIIFSDDLNMKGAEIAGNYPMRAKMALEAGCDMVLMCNNRAAVLEILKHLNHYEPQLEFERFKTLQGHFKQKTDRLYQMEEWKEKRDLLNRKIVAPMI